MLMILAALIVMPLLIPQHAIIPVQGATQNVSRHRGMAAARFYKVMLHGLG